MTQVNSFKYLTRRAVLIYRNELPPVRPKQLMDEALSILEDSITEAEAEL